MVIVSEGLIEGPNCGGSERVNMSFRGLQGAVWHRNTKDQQYLIQVQDQAMGSDLLVSEGDLLRTI